MTNDGVVEAYLSISKQYMNARSEVIEQIEDLFLKYGLEVDVRVYEGGGYTSPQDIVGKPDFFFTYVPNYGKRVGKGVASEYDYANKNATCLSYSDGGYFTVIHTINARNSNDWREYALVQPGNIVEVNSKHPGSANTTEFEDILNNMNLLPPPLESFGINGGHKSQLLML